MCARLMTYKWDVLKINDVQMVQGSNDTSAQTDSSRRSSAGKGGKLPPLPSFRKPGIKENVDDPDEFITLFLDKLEASEIPEARHASALITCMDLTDREWVRENIREWTDNAIAIFIQKFEDRDTKSNYIKKAYSGDPGPDRAMWTT